MPASNVPATFRGTFTDDEYELRGCIGRGKFGSVYKAFRISRHSGAPQREAVAIKLIPLDPRPEFLTLVKREVAIINQLSHPHVVRMRDVFHLGRSQGSQASPPGPAIALVMDLAKSSLQDYIARVQHLAEGGVRWLFQQLMLAVQHCHSRSVVQRDIKPANILLFKVSGADNHFILKLADFGWAKRYDVSAPKTRAGTLVYAAPEVLAACPTDRSAGSAGYAPEAADVWSCGVVLFHLLHPAAFRAVVDQQGGSSSGICDWASHIPPAAADGRSAESGDLLRWMLQVAPEKRASVGQVMAHPWFLHGLPPGASEMNNSGRQGSGLVSQEQMEEWLDAVIVQHTGVRLPRQAAPQQ